MCRSIHIMASSQMEKDQSHVTSTDVVHTLHNHLVAGFAGVRMIFPQSKDRRNAEGVVAVVARKDHRMDVAAEGNPPYVAGEGSAVRSHPGRNIPVAWLVGSVRGSVVGDCNHGAALVYHIHPPGDIRDAEASEIGKDRDMGLSPLRIGHQQHKSLGSLSTLGHRVSQRLF